MKKLIKIGIDPSTKNCGIALIINNKVEYLGTYIFKKNENDTFGNNLVNSQLEYTFIAVLKKIQALLKIADKKDVYENWELYVIVENGVIIGSHYQARTSQSLTLYSGAILYEISVLLKAIFIVLPKKTYFKLIPPNEWKLLAIPNAHLSGRENGKLAAIEVVKKYIKKYGNIDLENIIFDDNAADACCMAIFAENVRDKSTIRIEKIQRKKTKAKKKVDLLKTKYEIEKLEKIGLEKKHKFLEKIRNAKKSKYNYSEFENQPFHFFLNKKELKKYEFFNTKDKKVV